MSTILIVFGCIELAILLFGFASFSWWKEMEALLGCAVLVYGTGINILAFLVTTALYDHVRIHIGTR